MNFASATFYLASRSLRETLRQPGIEVSNLFIPIFFFFVTVGALGGIAAGAFDVDNYRGFALPVAVLQGAAGAAGSGGLGMVTDIERGYFDKLMLSPAPRLSLVMGRLVADGVRVTILTVVISTVALIFGAGMETGPGGFLALVVMSGAFGFTYSGIGMAIALKTGSPQAAQVGFLVFFPLLFLSPAFAPKEVFEPWLEFMATINPVTYIIEAQRSLVLDGWEWDKLGYSAAAIAGFGAFTLTLTMLALRTRTA
ncbi:MAG: ABC transporter permease [Chloroflexi bacterium]|nr:ABC transporter permease [Chloroflexota bacterium]